MLNSSTHMEDIKNHNVLDRSGRAHNIEMSSVQSGRAQWTHAFLGVITRPLPIHGQISGRALQLLNWFQLKGVLDLYFGPPLKVSRELLLIQIMLHKTVQTTHHLKLFLFAFHHFKDFRGCQVEVPPRFGRSLLLETLVWSFRIFGKTIEKRQYLCVGVYAEPLLVMWVGLGFIHK